jgi:hypothetical protein
VAVLHAAGDDRLHDDRGTHLQKQREPIQQLVEWNGDRSRQLDPVTLGVPARCVLPDLPGEVHHAVHPLERDVEAVHDSIAHVDA